MRIDDDWASFIRANWTVMPPDRPVDVPRYLPHPRQAGFARLALAEDVGQREDWGLRFDDGSRLHAHVLPDGRVRVHRDRWDPDASVADAALHFFLETRIGAAVGVLGLLGLGIWGVSRLK